MNEIIKIKEISKQKEGAKRGREREMGRREGECSTNNKNRGRGSSQSHLQVKTCDITTGMGICTNYWRAMYATTLNNLYGMDK